MLPALVLAVAVSTSSRAEELFEEEAEYEETSEEEEEEEWLADRSLRFTVHLGLRSDQDLVGALLSGGLVKRFHPMWSFQARLALDAGAWFLGLSTGFEAGAGVGSTLDATFRLGARRFYFGFGPYLRGWWQTVPDSNVVAWRSLEGSAGAVAEIGWLQREDRSLDLSLRGMAGVSSLGRGTNAYIGGSFVIGWLL